MFKEMVSRFLAGVLAIVMGAAAPMSPEVRVGGGSTEQLERPENSTFSIRFIDVGQADCALVSCDGAYMLIDGGNVEEEDEQGTTTPDPSPSNPDTGEEEDGGLAG